MTTEGASASAAAAVNPIPYSAPTPGASLILSHTPPSSSAILIVGSGNLATSRAFAALEAGLQPVLLPLPASPITNELQWRADQGQVRIIEPEQHQWEGLINANPEAWNTLLDKIDQFSPLSESLSAPDDEEQGPKLFAVCVTDTLTSSYPAQPPSSASTTTTTRSPLDLALSRASLLSKLCRRRRILLNVADRPHLCDFSFPAVHRFPLSYTSTASSPLTSPSSSSLQIAITTNGKGCRLASRLRREIVSALPRNVGDAVETVGWLRSLAKDELRQANAALADVSEGGEGGAETPRRRPSLSSGPGTPRPEKQAGYFGIPKKSSSDAQVDEEDTSFDPQPLNSPVPQLSISKSRSSRSASHIDPEQAQRRMRWVSQISEYWPIEYLGSLRSKPDELKELLSTYGGARTSGPSKHALPPAPPPPLQAGAGPAFTSPFSSALSVSPQNHAASDAADDIDEAQDRALRAAHDSMRRRSEAAAISVPDPHHLQGRDEGVHPEGAAATNADKYSDIDGDEAQRGRSSARPESRLTRNSSRSRSVHSLSLSLPPSASLDARKGHVYLLGSGPGHPGLLTQFAYRLLTSPTTDLILSDKLVPASILALIPSTTLVEIARKFPGNAEAAQSELIEKALQAAQGEGKTVVRLKQGDPFVYGRGGEEVLAFRAAGVSCSVVPGISSAFAGPLMLGIAVTQRGAADTFVLCTGVGRGGKSVALPGYSRSTTVALLMGVARLKNVVQILISKESTEAGEGRKGPAYPPYLPVAIIERASSADQRLVASTLENIANALERCGEQRPPGMILIGWTVLALEGEKGDATILDDGESLRGAELEARDRARVERWLKGKGYIVREGLDEAYAAAAASFLPVSTRA
ncbi:uroporphyrin-III C-methyltransferase [Tilletia horrida]|nr:uroporphyrin-III C-methyltransferase [Tilletia horrida]